MVFHQKPTCTQRIRNTVFSRQARNIDKRKTFPANKPSMEQI